MFFEGNYRRIDRDRTAHRYGGGWSARRRRNRCRAVV